MELSAYKSQFLKRNFFYKKFECSYETLCLPKECEGGFIYY